MRPHLVRINSTITSQSPIIFHVFLSLEVSTNTFLTCMVWSTPFRLLHVYSFSSLWRCFARQYPGLVSNWVCNRKIVISHTGLSDKDHANEIARTCFNVWKMRISGSMHRNFRCQLCLAGCVYCLGIMARFVLIFYQLLDIPLTGALMISLLALMSDFWANKTAEFGIF